MDAGREKTTLKQIKETKGVAHVSAVYGRWDLVVDIEAEDLPSMTHIVVRKSARSPGLGRRKRSSPRRSERVRPIRLALPSSSLWPSLRRARALPLP
jgi:DNA-binding Lrp family transcriptional regulator